MMRTRIVTRFVLVALMVAPAFTSAQLLDRGRLKQPLLRLPLGQRAPKKNSQANQTPRVAAAPAIESTSVPQPVPGQQALPTQQPLPVQPLANGQLPLASQPATQPAPRQLLPGQVPAAPLATPTPQPGGRLGQPLANVSGVPAPTATPSAVPRAMPAATPTDTAGVINKVASISPPMELDGPTQKMNRAMDEAERALTHMRANVRDYTCDFIKRERVKGSLVARETMALKVRNRVVENGQVVSPLRVYMKFKGPREFVGREVLFTEGTNNEKLLCKEGGTRGRFIPAMLFNQASSFVMSTNRYPISQIGMTRLAERLLENGRATPVDDCQVKYIPGAKVDGRVCSYLEIIRPTPRPGLPVGHNNVNCARIFIDTELMMPVRFEAYDWPAQPGGKARLIEEYTYRNIKVNVNLTDHDFSRDNKAYKF